jgi:hypothetical protein
MILGFAEGFPTMLKGEIAMVFLIRRHYSVSCRMQEFENANVNNNTCAYYLVIFVSFPLSYIFFSSSKCSLKFTTLRMIVQLQLQMASRKMMNFNLRLKCWISLKPRLFSLNGDLSMTSDVYFITFRELANSLHVYFNNFIYSMD